MSCTIFTGNLQVVLMYLHASGLFDVTDVANQLTRVTIINHESFEEASVVQWSAQ